MIKNAESMNRVKNMGVYLGIMSLFSSIYGANELYYGNVIRIKNLTNGQYVTATSMPHPLSTTEFSIVSSQKPATNRDTLWEIGSLTSKGQQVVSGATVTLRSIGQDYFLATRAALENIATAEGALLGTKNASDTNINWIWSPGYTQPSINFFMSHANTQNSATGVRWMLNWNGSSFVVSSNTLSSEWFAYEIVAQDASAYTTQPSTTTQPTTTQPTPTQQTTTTQPTGETTNEKDEGSSSHSRYSSWVDRRQAMIEKQRAGKWGGIQKSVIKKTPMAKSANSSD